MMVDSLAHKLDEETSMVCEGTLFVGRNHLLTLLLRTERFLERTRTPREPRQKRGKFVPAVAWFPSIGPEDAPNTCPRHHSMTIFAKPTFVLSYIYI